MPIKDKICQKCNTQFETLIIRSTDEAEVECPKCGSKELNTVPGYMALYEVKGNNNASTPSRKRHKQCDDSG